VMVTSVPYQLQSSEVAKKRARKRQEWNAPGSVRRGPAGEGRPKEASGKGSAGSPDTPGPDSPGPQA
jgi:hypothetical protein